MGTKCFHDIQVIDSQQVTNSPKDSQTPKHRKKPIQNELPSQNYHSYSNSTRLSNPNLGRKVAKPKNIITSTQSDAMSEEYEKSVLTVIKKHNKNAENEELIEQCLIKHFFMSGLERQARLEIIKEMSLVSINENTIIFKQGGKGSYFYILKQGSVQISSSNAPSSFQCHCPSPTA